jgi:hypothetical protein
MEETPDQLASLTNEFLAEYKELGEEDWDHLAGLSLASEHQIPEQSQRLRQVAASLGRIAARSDAWFRTLDVSTLTKLQQAMGHINKGRRVLRGYAESPPDPTSAAEVRKHNDARITNIAVTVANLLDPLFLRLDVDELKRGADDIKKVTEGLTTLGETFRHDSLALAEIAKDTIAEAKRGLAIVREAAAEQGVARKAIHFGSVARSHAIHSYAWIVVTAALAYGLLTLIHDTIENPKHAPPFASQDWWVAGNLSYFGARVLGVSVLSFLLVVSVRSFRASRHNQITNAHRASALGTFQELRDAASGPVADAVLLQATDAIFRPQPTGFGDESVGAPNHVAEMMKMFRQEAAKSSKAE